MSHSPDSAEQAEHVKQLSFFAAITTLGWVFWVCGGMEMIERLAFYGVKAVATIYAKDPVSKGGLGVTMSEFGNILMTWALVQSIVPVFTGGLSDRYGYKQTIFMSTIIKIAGYLIMWRFPTFNGFFAGAVVLAIGTGAFKPAIQGTIVKAMDKRNSSMTWGIFYQTVNIGGFLGPLVAGLMRKMAWNYVFLACAGIISINFILLLLYQEPGKAERLARRAEVLSGTTKEKSLWRESLHELRMPKLWVFLSLMCGFWFMFTALFDVLPAHIDDWVDTRGIVTSIFSDGGKDSAIAKFLVVLNKDGTEIQPEGLLNINAGLIMATCFIFAFISGKMRPTTSMMLGTLLATASTVMAGSLYSGWWMVIAILTFSVGEMLASPKFNEFIGNIAPPDKKAMYLGFANMPFAVGWTIEGKLGPALYDHFASKDAIARRELADLAGWTSERIAQIPQGEAFDRLVTFLGGDRWQVTEQLYHANNIGMVWYIMAAIGLASAFGLYIYGRWLLTLRQDTT